MLLIRSGSHPSRVKLGACPECSRVRARALANGRLSPYQPVAEVPADQAGLSATTVTKIDKLSEDVAIRINATAWSV